MTKCEYCGTHFRLDVSQKTDDCPNCGAPAKTEETPYAYRMLTASTVETRAYTATRHDGRPIYFSPYGVNE